MLTDALLEAARILEETERERVAFNALPVFESESDGQDSVSQDSER